MNFLTNLLAPEFIRTIGEAIDNLTTSDEERGKLKLDVLRNQLETVRETNKLELAKLQAKRDIIVAEAQSESWLARNWRPIVMLMFAFTTVAYAFGIVKVDSEYVGHFFTLLTVGLGGHVIGRSGEKIVKTWRRTKPDKEESNV